MSDLEASSMAGQPQASHGNVGELLEPQEVANGNKLSSQIQLHTTLPRLSEDMQCSLHKLSSSSELSACTQLCRSALQLSSAQSYDLSNHSVTVNPRDLYSGVTARAAGPGSLASTSLRQPPLARLSSSGAIRKLPASTHTRAMPLRRRYVESIRRSTTSSEPLHGTPPDTVSPLQRLLPDRPLTDKPPSSSWRLWTDPTRSTSRQPVIWTANGKMLLSDTDIRFGNVVSPRYMIGLPFAAGSMIEVAHHYPEEEACGEVVAQEWTHE